MTKRCIVFINSKNPGDGRVVLVPSGFEDFMKSCSDKLGIHAVKAYTESGGIIQDTSVIREDEKIFVSAGEPFWKYSDSKVKNYKIAVLGPGGVGKSCLALQYIRSTFVEVYDPTIEDAFRHQTVVDGQVVVLDILDTAGQEDMHMLRRQWVQDKDGFLVVFAIVSRTSFEEMDTFIQLIINSREDGGVPFVLIGNKSDLEDSRQVSKEEAVDFGKSHGAPYLETSARTSSNVSQSFEMLIRLLLSKNPLVSNEQPENRKRSFTSKLGRCLLL